MGEGLELEGEEDMDGGLVEVLRESLQGHLGIKKEDNDLIAYKEDALKCKVHEFEDQGKHLKLFIINYQGAIKGITCDRIWLSVDKNTPYCRWQGHPYRICYASGKGVLGVQPPTTMVDLTYRRRFVRLVPHKFSIGVWKLQILNRGSAEKVDGSGHSTFKTFHYNHRTTKDCSMGAYHR
ncbi:hypothetical protein M9H77_17782 [Catharanthus roseus]|uniref:Uncharacterized protein n=1 Tax=Catharanthus roseus TaxID=4058 RepID=A0ACC0B5M6_CATRO|nr:hypothetical protein M9H77_17782 [Catharanthus roseus]